MILVKNEDRVLNITNAVEYFTASNGSDLIATGVGHEGVDYRIHGLTLERVEGIIRANPTKTIFIFEKEWSIPYMDY